MPHDLSLPRAPDYFIDRLADLHGRIRDRLWKLSTRASVDNLSAVAAPREGDTIFAIDLHAEEVLDDFFSAWGEDLPLLVVAEGFPGDGGRTFPEGTPRESVAFTCIVDPIDGTRGLMYGKRSGWTLTAVAPAPVKVLPSLSDIRVAMQTELPTARSHLSDVLWAVEGRGALAETHNLESGEVRPFHPRPSGAESLLYGFATVAKFFPGGKVLAAEIEERLSSELFGSVGDGNPQIFDDEYIASGGQIYELIVGHDRFVADLRPVLQAAVGTARLCAHTYDLCTELIARETGVEVTDVRGRRLRYPLDIRVNCGWVGYANAALRARVEPVLRKVLSDLGLPTEL